MEIVGCVFSFSCFYLVNCVLHFRCIVIVVIYFNLLDDYPCTVFQLGSTPNLRTATWSSNIIENNRQLLAAARVSVLQILLLCFTMCVWQHHVTNCP